MKGILMGLAASQAKLLSLTSRISDNELRSQSITAAKMSLANQTAEASRKYINALNSTEFIYRTYDSDGNQAYTDLTGFQLTTYSPLKNQYGLINNAGQILVSETDAANYESSENLNEFLAKYGIDSIDTGRTKTVTNPGYEEAYGIWREEYNSWLEKKPDPTSEVYWTHTTGSDTELYQAFKVASRTCYGNALSGSSECYLHVLAHMIDLEVSPSDTNSADTSKYPKTRATSISGLNITIYGRYARGHSEAINSSAIHYSGNTRDMVKVSDAIANGWKGQTVYAHEHPEDTLTQSSSTAEKLLSNYTFDASGNKVLKTLYQKCIDLYYAVYDNSHGNSLGTSYSTTLLKAIMSFQEDMEFAFSEDIFDEAQYNSDLEDWQEDEPTFDMQPTLEEPVYEYSDKDMAQWYVNLWHRMNGESFDKDGMETTTTVSNINSIEYGTSVIETSTSTTTKTTKRRWDILEDGLMNSPQWLKYALESGTISMERVNFANPTEEGTGLKNAEWASIIYTNALDISEQTDETAIAKAEAEYEQKSREIESKDKQYDSMLKLLDTEHTALQAEFDSVKQVINKNMERTLKIYSA